MTACTTLPVTIASVRATAAEFGGRIVALTPRNAPPDAAARSRREAGFKAILGEIESWAARNDLTIALRSAACREISNTILRGVEQPASGDMLRQTRTVLLRAGVDS